MPFKLFEPEQIDYSLQSPFAPAGDQPEAIEQLDTNLREGVEFQTLLGVTGSGKTFTIANVLEKQNRPALIIAPNKTLAAQLYSEFREFFPENRVRYFVSYYDYYQPEAYVPSSDTYIEKDAAINEEIDKLRHSATRSVLETSDTIIVASVSCIYGLGAPEDYFNLMFFAEVGDRISRKEVIEKLVYMQYRRSDLEFTRGKFRVRGETIDIFPSDDDMYAVRLVFFGDEIEEIVEIDGLSGEVKKTLNRCAVYPVSHFLTGKERINKAIKLIEKELLDHTSTLVREGKTLEAQRLEQRTLYDLELLKEVGFCPGIENYSRHLAGRAAGESPTTLLDYFPDNYILFIDESHVTVPQIGGMYRGDRARKQTLVDFGFRLPSALDNRPLNPDEFWARAHQTVFVSATPGDKELERSSGLVVELVNRPTGLLDPPVEVVPATNQVDHVIAEARKTIEQGDRVLITTLTKKMAESLAQYFRDVGVKAKYLHADINAIERVEILRGLRRGDFDVLIGINLLREGLDLVEVSLVAILDADKEGFLRSARSLIQTMGRAARNVRGRVILYADKETDAIKEAIAEAERRRAIQSAFNAEHGVVPQSALRGEQVALVEETEDAQTTLSLLGESVEIPETPKAREKLLQKLKKDMFQAASKREFEKAAALRDTLRELQEFMLKHEPSTPNSSGGAEEQVT